MAKLASKSKRQLTSGSVFGAGVLLAIALFGIVNYFGWKYHQRFDWTRSRLYSLSEKTENVLRDLDRDVEVVVFLSPAEELYSAASELLSRYEAGSPRLSVRHVDPEKNLLEAQNLVSEYELSHLSVVVFDAGNDRRVVDGADLADYDYSGLQMGVGPQMTGFKGEQVFTSALINLLESRKPKIVFTTGHGEAELDDFSPEGLSAARELLGRDNFELEEWASLGQGAAPADTDLVVIAGPTSTFLEPELAVLGNFLEAGGRLLVLLDPTLSPAGGLVKTGLESLLADYGVEVGEDIVVDPTNPLPFFGADTIFVNSYGDHVITRSLDQAQLPVVVALARSARPDYEVEGLTVVELMSTSLEGWGETDLANLQQVAKSEEDFGGPVPLAVAVEMDSLPSGSDEEVMAAATEEGDLGPSQASSEASSVESGEADSGKTTASGLRLVVVGDSDFATNSQMQNVPNATFLANALNWLVERETLVGIPPKEPEHVRLGLTSGELSRLVWLVLLGLPGLTILAGLIVFLKRRR
jgi:ABC-type uncharacterized transport system involved in gliding motility auxiliary subunit